VESHREILLATKSEAEKNEWLQLFKEMKVNLKFATFNTQI